MKISKEINQSKSDINEDSDEKISQKKKRSFADEILKDSPSPNKYHNNSNIKSLGNAPVNKLCIKDIQIEADGELGDANQSSSPNKKLIPNHSDPNVRLNVNKKKIMGLNVQ